MQLSHVVSLIAASFATPAVANTRSFRDEVLSIREAFKTLDRRTATADQLIDLKYKMMHWRLKSLDKVLARITQSPTTTESHQLLEALSALDLKPPVDALNKIENWIARTSDSSVREQAARYFAFIAEHDLLDRVRDNASTDSLKLAGPRRKLPIVGNAPSRWTFKKWAKLPEFSDYLFTESGVNYRGIEFMPGDIILAGLNRDGNGVYTTMCEPKGYTYHLAVFAIVEHEGGKLPVVVEAYKLGVRVVPLSTFCTSNFTSYAEVLRLKAKPENFHEKLNEYALKICDEIKGYNFDTEDPDRTYISCTTVGNYLFELAGAAPIRTKSRYSQHPGTWKNLVFFELTPSAFLSPTDYLIDDRLEVVGALDNGHFNRGLAREVFEYHFIETFQNFEVREKNFPIMYWLNLFGIRQMRKGTFVGTLVGLPYGMNQSNLPRGPERVMAVIELFEHQLEHAVKHADSAIAKAWDHTKLVDVAMLPTIPAVVELAERNMAPIRRSFVKAYATPLASSLEAE